jgi:methyl-accepting chemotaxis protein
MSQTLQEIARNTSDAAECAASSQSQGNEAGRLMERTREAMDRLAERMQISSQTVERLAESSREIGTVLEVINGVAQQTSLLALNASIEAARAGDSGRGFAVVADEVRELATRTQQSTGEIQAIIDRLQGSADEATQSMEENHLEAERTRESSVESLRQLEQLINGFEEITGLTAQIASATEQQTTAAGQLSGNISEISQLADSAKSASTQCVERISAFAEEVRRMRGLVNQFQR